MLTEIIKTAIYRFGIQIIAVCGLTLCCINAPALRFHLVPVILLVLVCHPRKTEGEMDAEKECRQKDPTRIEIIDREDAYSFGKCTVKKTYKMPPKRKELHTGITGQNEKTKSMTKVSQTVRKPQKGNTDVKRAINGSTGNITYRDAPAILLTDDMTGVQFEEFCMELLNRCGFIDVCPTVASGDDGVDILARKGKETYAFQCKCYSGRVPRSAVQEVYTGRAVYECDRAVVITNSYYTESAKTTAEKTGVQLWDRKSVMQMLVVSGSTDAKSFDIKTGKVDINKNEHDKINSPKKGRVLC